MDISANGKVVNFIQLNTVPDFSFVIKMDINERRKDMCNGRENYGERKSIALTLVLLSLATGGGIAPGVATMWIGEKIYEGRRKRKADGERLAY